MLENSPVGLIKKLIIIYFLLLIEKFTRVSLLKKSLHDLKYQPSFFHFNEIYLWFLWQVYTVYMTTTQICKKDIKASYRNLCLTLFICWQLPLEQFSYILLQHPNIDITILTILCIFFLKLDWNIWSIRVRGQNRPSKDSNQAQWMTLKNVKEG